MNRKWIKSEDDYLKQNHKRKPNQEIARFLKRTLGSVESRITKLKIGVCHGWSVREVAILKANYLTNWKDLPKLLPNRDANSIRGKAFRLGLKVSSEIRANLNSFKHDISEFLNITKPEVAYLLGYMWADGNVSKQNNNIQIEILDTDAKRVRDIFCKYLPFKVKYKKRNGKKHNSIVFRISDRFLKKFLVEQDFLIKTGASADKILSKIPEALQHYWWRGYFDGDGCMTWQMGTSYSGRFLFAACYNQDWSFVKKMFKRIGCSPFRITRGILKNRGKFIGRHSSIICHGLQNLKNFYNYIYSGEQFGLFRKLNRFNKYFELRNKIKPKSKEGYRGVRRSANGNRFFAVIVKNKKRIYLGTYDTKKEAALAYNKKALKLKGANATLNNTI